jgi:predicted DNA binding protein
MTDRPDGPLVVELHVRGDDCPLAAATGATGATVDATPPLLRRDGTTLVRCSTGEAALVETLSDDDRVVELHRDENDERWTLRFRSRRPCAVHSLIDTGLHVESVRHNDGSERYTGTVPDHAALRTVLDATGEVTVSLDRVSPLSADGETPVGRRWDLTARQAEAVALAVRMGYFSVPREADAGAVAAELGVSKSAFLERLRRAQATVFGHIFDD